MMNLKRILLGTALVSAAIVLIGCPDTSLLAALAGTTDTTGPTPGNVGAITVDATDQTTLDISWTAASDDTTAEAEIEYQVYYSISDNIGTAEDAAANGTPVLGLWTRATVSAALTGLTRATGYWVNVVVRDLAGNMTAYSVEGVSTAVGPVIRVTQADVGTIPEDYVVDYGSWIAPKTVSITYGIWNDGDQDLTLSPASVDRVVVDSGTGAFSVKSLPASQTLPPAGTQAFEIEFYDMYEGPTDHTGTVTIWSNDPGNPNFAFRLKAHIE